MSAVQLFLEGGFIMWPLLLCSLAIWGVAAERIWTVVKFQNESTRLFTKAITLIKSNKLEEAKGLYGQADQLIANPLNTLFQEAQMNTAKDRIEEKLKRQLLETQLGLKKFMWVLGTIGSSAPFIGLFGTVVGIIKSFQTIEQTGKSGFSVVAGDLSEALVATAAGILVAVVAVMFYNYLQTRINNTNLVFRNQVEEMADQLLK
jgi:biopolymer transport protein ExbB